MTGNAGARRYRTARAHVRATARGQQSRQSLPVRPRRSGERSSACKGLWRSHVSCAMVVHREPSHFGSPVNTEATTEGAHTVDAAEPPEDLTAIRRDLIAGDAQGASRSLLRSVAPRLLRDILGPTLSFYLGWK